MPFDRVAQYRVLELIGRGGMGEIYTAHDESLERLVVLKIIQSQHLDATTRSRFVREARAAAALSHPFICSIYEVLEHEGQPVIVMEYVRGQTVFERTAAGPLPPREVCRLGREMAEALAAAHARGIVHRDVSASNVMITVDGHVKLMDFGLARVEHRQDSPGDVTVTAIPAPLTGNVIMGTPAYTAPEVLNGKTADARSDLYAAGVVLYRMTTGRLPFGDGTSAPLLSDILMRAPAPPRAFLPEVPWALERAILRLLEKDPDARFQTAASLVAALGELSRGHIESSRAARSVAVLPFKPIGRTESGSDLGLGLADATITDLALIRSLLVRPTSAIVSYQERPLDAVSAGRELSVDAVVYGSFQELGGRVRVTVQLVSTETGEPLWGTKIDKSLDDVFALQDEVSRQIVQALEVRLTKHDEDRLHQAVHAASPAQHEYMRGRVAALHESIERLNEAIDAFQRAIEIDPAFAPAYAGLAHAFLVIAFTYLPESDYYDRAQSMCEKALSIDPHLSEARLVRARLAWTPKAGFNHEMAMREAGAALAGQPNLGQGWTTMGLIAFHIGLTEEARMLCVRGLAIDPGDVFALTHIAYTHYLEGDWRRAVAAAAEVWRRAPSSWAGYQLALSHLHEGQFAAAQQLTDRVMRQFVGDVLLHPINALIAALHGDPARVRHHIELTVRHEKGFGHYHHAQYDVGCSLALIGAADEALDWLEQAAENGFPCVVLFERDPWLDSLRQLARFAALLTRLREESARLAAVYREVMRDSGRLSSAARS